MNALTRTTSVLLMLALIAPSFAYPAFAEDASTTDTSTDVSAPPPETPSTTTSDTTTSESSTSGSTTTTSSGTETASTTNANVSDTSTSSSMTASSTESDTTTHEVLSAPTATTTTDIATTTSDGMALVPPPQIPPEESTSSPTNTVATNSSATAGTSTSSNATTTPPSPTASSTTITTGDATAGANVVNVAGSNFVNSSGEVVLGNYFGTSSDIDLRTATSAFSTGAVCFLFTCSGSEGVTLNLTGTTSLDNLLALNATTGQNVITAPGDASIFTGNAYVGLNLVNLANLNVVDSAYLIAALNFFKGINGDLVFPGLQGFFDALASSSAPSSVTLDSNAGVDNQIGFTTQTGNNQTDATSSSLSTGAGASLATVLNQLNSSLIGGANLGILLRITGTWNGQIFGAPDGLSVIRGDDGSIFITKAGQASAGVSDASLSASTTALISNHADLSALTGGNGIFGADSARIVTGNALAGANVLTLANQNIIGRNWITAVINIFGDWNGNLDFGRPDLWVGERVEAPATISNGSDLVFHFTITNRGDAPAHGASFAAALDSAHLSASDLMTADLGTLAPGATQEVVIHAVVHDAPPGTSIDTSGTISETETDNNPADNHDQIALVTSSGGGSLSANERSYPKATTVAPASLITVTRSTAHQLSEAQGTVHESLVIKNTSDATSTPYDLHDLVKDPNGTIIEDQAWPVGTLAPHEEVRVSYDLAFDASAPSGVYLLSTVLASDIVGDTEFKNNGSIVRVAPLALLTSATPSVHPHGISAPLASTSAPTISREIATSTPTHAPDNPLAAAALLAHTPIGYAAGFAGSAGLLSLFLWGVVGLRRRFP